MNAEAYEAAIKAVYAGQLYWQKIDTEIGQMERGELPNDVGIGESADQWRRLAARALELHDRDKGN
jgi:hypothetical protein